jgi:hypothetical protein
VGNEGRRGNAQWQSSFYALMYFPCGNPKPNCLGSPRLKKRHLADWEYMYRDEHKDKRDQKERKEPREMPSFCHNCHSCSVLPDLRLVKRLKIACSIRIAQIGETGVRSSGCVCSRGSACLQTCTHAPSRVNAPLFFVRSREGGTASFPLLVSSGLTLVLPQGRFDL